MRRPATPSAAASSGKVRIDRSGDAAGAAADLDANSYTAGDTIVMPQHHGPLDRGRGQALLAHELVHVGQQRRLGSSLPAEHTSGGQQLEREAQSAESLVERSRSTGALDMPLARSPQRAAAGSASGPSSDVRQATQLALAAGDRGSSIDSIELPPSSQAAADAHGTAPQRAALGSARSPALASAATSGGGGGGASAGAAKPYDDEEFEELARKLYERLRLRFKRELLLDRERSGFLTDSR